MNYSDLRKILATCGRIRHALESSQKLIASLDTKLLCEDGRATKAALLKRSEKQIKQLELLEQLEMKLSDYNSD